MKIISEDVLGIVTIWQEANGEPYQGKVCVGEVIRNRMEARHFSDGTVAGTVCWPRQFSGWNDNNRNRALSLKIDDSHPVVIECIRAWYESAKTNFTKGSLFYLNVDLVRHNNDGLLPKWWLTDTVADGEIKIGDHTFRRKR